MKVNVNFSIDISAQEVLQVIDKIEELDKARNFPPAGAPAPSAVASKLPQELWAQIKAEVGNDEMEHHNHSDFSLVKNMNYAIVGTNEKHIRIGQYWFPRQLFNISNALSANNS